jgi:hypothetical protein
MEIGYVEENEKMAKEAMASRHSMNPPPPLALQNLNGSQVVSSITTKNVKVKRVCRVSGCL